MGGPSSIIDRCPLPDPSIEEAVARIALLNTGGEGAIRRLPGAADIAVAANAAFACDGAKLD
eukprot:4169966-Lingulodinium_polyedra.AAC.1